MAEKQKKSGEFIPTPQQKKAMRNRAFGLALVVAAFAVLIYLGTLAKLGF